MNHIASDGRLDEATCVGAKTSFFWPQVEIERMSDFVYKGEDFKSKVRKQVEFYFSDSNLQTDRFLWKIYQANDGWVELKTILTFGRMRQYRPEEKVLEALRESDKLVLSKNEDMIRRKDPLKEFNDLKSTRKRNSVHIEGFPKEATQEDLEEWFNSRIVDKLPKEKTICSIRRIRSRAKKEFFGVADVEFKTQEDAEFFLKNLDVVYPEGVVSGADDNVDNKAFLKKMSLLTFQEMRESGKRFGVNDVTKRRNSFNESRNNKKFKKSKDKNAEPKSDKSGDSNSESKSDEAGTAESKPVLSEDSTKEAIAESSKEQSEATE